jgi:glycyl-tRNA synthetase beta chain
MGIALALADRIDTLMGIFLIGQAPSGDKDPFALRRAALGILRIIIEKELSLDLKALFTSALETLLINAPHIKCDKEQAIKSALDFVLGRLQTWYQEQGIPTEVYLVTRAQNITAPLDFDKHIKAVNYFYTLSEAKSLAAANKRVANILNKSTDFFEKPIDSALLIEPAEKALYEALTNKQAAVLPILRFKQYQEALVTLTELKDPVDAFFDSVMVNADDVAIRNNRLNLLQALRNLFLSVADISILSIAK